MMMMIKNYLFPMVGENSKINGNCMNRCYIFGWLVFSLRLAILAWLLPS